MYKLSFVIYIAAVFVGMQCGKSKKTNCECGWTNEDEEAPRILGGSETGINEFPMIVGLRDPEDAGPFCGGVILTNRHILTAAHCLADNEGGPMEAMIGDHDVFDRTETDATQMIKVIQFAAHEDYNKTGNEENDIAILYLQKPIQFSRKVGPVCMPTEKLELVKSKVLVMGWGKLKPDKMVCGKFKPGPRSPKLRKVDLNVVPLNYCDQAFPGSIPLSKGKTIHICTYTKNKDSCQGDSGGPVLWYDEDIKAYINVGIISFGGDCGESPGANTDVFKYKDWILNKIKSTDKNAKVCHKI